MKRIFDYSDIFSIQQMLVFLNFLLCIKWYVNYYFEKIGFALSEFGLKRCKGSNLLSLVRLPTTTVPSTTTMTSTSKASPSTTTVELDSDELQEFKICIDMQSKDVVDEDVLVLKTNMDTQITYRQPVLKKNGPNTKTTCPTIPSKNKPHFKIMTTGSESVSTVQIPVHYSSHPI